MKVFLPGHEGSKHILAASSWLVNKYLPKDFDVYWLNYGEYDGELFCGKYVNMDIEQVGGYVSWSSYLIGEIQKVKDEYIILGLDDYLLGGELNRRSYDELIDNIKGDVICGRLSDSTDMEGQRFFGKSVLSTVRLAFSAYTCVAQWCVWDREKLIEILNTVNSSWMFEMYGTRMMNRNGYRTIGVIPEVLTYSDHSALSAKWIGVDTEGVKPEDLKELKELGYV